VAIRDDDEVERLAEVITAQERDAARPHIFDPASVLFRGTVVMGIIVAMFGGLGGVWGIAMAFSSFKSGAENVRADIMSLRGLLATQSQAAEREMAVLRADTARLTTDTMKDLAVFKIEVRKTRWSVQEMKWWAKAMRDQNSGKVSVPDVADYMIDREP
jgi:hypothetical protein